MPIATVTYLEMADKAAERIYLACQRHEEGQKRIKAILDAYNPKGSTQNVSFSTTKSTWKTAPGKCHVNYVVLDSDWEAELARVLESHPKVRAYVKNQGMQFEVPYRDGAVPRKYIPAPAARTWASAQPARFDRWTYPHSQEQFCYMPSSACGNNHRVTN